VHRRQEVERELIRDRELLSHQATHDLLTGLPNRTVLLDRLDAVLAGTPAHDESVSAVLFVDLDRFKPINDRYGHDTGDLVLRVIAERLRATVRPGDTVSRFGGDEFAVFCESLESRAVASAVAQRIRREIERPIAARGHTVSVGASVGIAFCSGEGVTPTTLLADADAAMYEAKGRRAVREG
jgi:diguanylate cyclase (GGDEF)-like protein